MNSEDVILQSVVLPLQKLLIDFEKDRVVDLIYLSSDFVFKQTASIFKTVFSTAHRSWILYNLLFPSSWSYLVNAIRLSIVMRFTHDINYLNPKWWISIRIHWKMMMTEFLMSLWSFDFLSNVVKKVSLSCLDGKSKSGEDNISITRTKRY